MKFRIAAALVLVLVIGLAAGWFGAVAATAGVVPVRRGETCAAWDTDTGRAIGEWRPSGARCVLRDWRLSHPFHGLF